MSDAECVNFLQWALPHMEFRWAGFRKVRGQVCKRLSRRLRTLELVSLPDYRSYLEKRADEWSFLDSLCRISISHFYRDRSVFEYLSIHVLPALAREVTNRGNPQLRVWCIGCAGGEEAYTIRILWDMTLRNDFPDVSLTILGTDADPHQVERAKIACYPGSALAELPAGWLTSAFEGDGNARYLRAEFKTGIEFQVQDVRHVTPEEVFELIFCRNLVFTYFSEDLQVRVGKTIESHLIRPGFLVVGKHEGLPAKLDALCRVDENMPVYTLG